MRTATITRFHSSTSESISPASLLFTLTTSSLLSSPSSSPSSSQTMLIETHDPGVIARLDQELQGTELPVNRVVGWMWEGEDEAEQGKGREAEVEDMIRTGEEHKAGITLKQFTWQAYTADEEHKQDDDEDTPSPAQK